MIKYKYKYIKKKVFENAFQIQILSKYTSLLPVLSSAPSFSSKDSFRLFDSSFSFDLPPEPTINLTSCLSGDESNATFGRLFAELVVTVGVWNIDELFRKLKRMLDWLYRKTCIFTSCANGALWSSLSITIFPFSINIFEYFFYCFIFVSILQNVSCNKIEKKRLNCNL